MRNAARTDVSVVLTDGGVRKGYFADSLDFPQSVRDQQPSSGDSPFSGPSRAELRGPLLRVLPVREITHTGEGVTGAVLGLGLAVLYFVLNLVFRKRRNTREVDRNVAPPNRSALLEGSSERKIPLIASLFSIKGRMTRRQFWIFELGIIVAAIFLMIGDVVVIEFIRSSGKTGGPLFGAVLFLFIIIPMFWAQLAVGAKRCHDRGRTGWFMAYALIPVIGTLWVLFDLGFLKGTCGRNDYGPDSLQRTSFETPA